MTTVLDFRPLLTPEQRAIELAAHLDIMRTEAKVLREQNQMLRQALQVVRDLARIEVDDGSVAWTMALSALDRTLRLTA